MAATAKSGSQACRTQPTAPADTKGRTALAHATGPPPVGQLQPLPTDGSTPERPARHLAAPRLPSQAGGFTLIVAGSWRVGHRRGGGREFQKSCGVSRGRVEGLSEVEALLSCQPR